MNRDIPHSEHYAIIQMVGQDAKRWPLKVVKSTCRPYQTSSGLTDYYWSNEYFTGFYKVLAVFLTKGAAEEYRKKISPRRYCPRQHLSPQWNGTSYIGYRILNPEETEEILKQYGVASHPDCVYTYQKEKESYSLWLRRQHP